MRRSGVRSSCRPPTSRPSSSPTVIASAIVSSEEHQYGEQCPPRRRLHPGRRIVSPLKQAACRLGVAGEPFALREAGSWLLKGSRARPAPPSELASGCHTGPPSHPLLRIPQPLAFGLWPLAPVRIDPPPLVLTRLSLGRAHALA